MSYGRLTYDDVRGFDTDARKLVLAAMECGITGRISSKGHAILRNPATGRTASVARKISPANRSAQNSRRDLERLIQPGDFERRAVAEPFPSPPISKEIRVPSPRRATAPSTVSKTVDPLTCPECGWTAQAAKGLGAHRQRKHGVVGQSKASVNRRKLAAEVEAKLAESPTEPDWSEPTTFGEPPAPEPDVRPRLEPVQEATGADLTADQTYTVSEAVEPERSVHTAVLVLDQIRQLLDADGELNRLRAEVAELVLKVDQANQRASDAETKLALVRESLGL